jgi:hypothetical protein
MPEWLDDLERYEHVSGDHAAVGSRGRHHYNQNGRTFTMDKEILEARPYEYLKFSLNSTSLDMMVECYLSPAEDEKTAYRATAVFTRVSLPMRLMMVLFMPHRKAQAHHAKQINRLKELIERT